MLKQRITAAPPDCALWAITCPQPEEKATDVRIAPPLLVIHNDKGEIEGVKYDHMNVVLINAIKEQQDQITKQQSQIEQLQQQQNVLRLLADRLARQKQQMARLKKFACATDPRPSICK